MQRSTILCFSGQAKDTVRLSKHIYESTLILRIHLDRCEQLCRKFGVCHFYPEIFSEQPVQDVVLLHCMLFSIQYAFASSWIDCGLQVKAVVGHSFGHFAAMCISGSIQLEDALRLVIGRARLIHGLWGSEKGAMLSIEADNELLTEILSLHSSINTDEKDLIEIACYNGPSSHVVAGSERAVACIEEVVATLSTTHKNLWARRLCVTHGWHSYLMDPLIPELTALADTINFQKPIIPVETCTREKGCGQSDSQSVAAHSRRPVYFLDAIRRLEAEYGSCLWLEAGSGSSIVNMIRHAVRPIPQGTHAYQPLMLTHDSPMEKLADFTVNLWNLGVMVQFWPYHRIQRRQYSPIWLPPYPFRRTKHWLEYKEPQIRPMKENLEASRKFQTPLRMSSLVSFIRPQSLGRSMAEFRINLDSRQFETYVQGHVVIKHGICPASLYIHLATKAASTLIDDVELSSGMFLLRDIEFTASLSLDPKQRVSLLLESDDEHPLTWTYRFSSHDATNLAVQVTHATGTILFQNRDKATSTDQFAQNYDLSRLHCLQLLADDDSDTSIAGSYIYKAFSSIVIYSKFFQGLRKVAWNDLKVAGRVSIQEPPSGLPRQLLWDPVMVDNFVQVAGFYINCLRDGNEDGLYICTKIATLDQAPTYRPDRLGPWEVLATFEIKGNGDVYSDIIVFDIDSDIAVVKISGLRFAKIQKALLTKALSRVEGKTNTRYTSVEDTSQVIPTSLRRSDPQRQREESYLLEEILAKVRIIINKLTDVPFKDMQYDSRLEDIGVDSLMTIEVLTEIDEVFNRKIPMHEFQEIVDLKSLCLNIQTKNGYENERIQQALCDSMVIDMPTKAEMDDNNQASKQVQIATPESNGLYPHNDHTALTNALRIGQNSDRMSGITGSTTTLFSFRHVSEAFLQVKTESDCIASDMGFAGFNTLVRPRQAELVIAYVVEAIESLGCLLSQMRKNEILPHIPCLTKHNRLMARLLDILEHAALLRTGKGRTVRTDRPVKQPASSILYKSLVQAFPTYSLEHRLLTSMGPCLADCLSGKIEATHLMFGTKSSRDLLEEVYTNAPIFSMGTKLLLCFLSNLINTVDRNRPIRILEIGARTGATTKAILKMLDSHDFPYSYTFTDISPSLVAAARKNLGDCDTVKFAVLDIEATPPETLIGSQDVIISTNAIHATKNLVTSLANAHALLTTNGFLCLVELTRGLEWFDVCFGLLDGWWRFEDSRTHAIADESLWKDCLLDAGFENVDWTVGDTEESNQIRLFIAYGSKISCKAVSETPKVSKESLVEMETILFRYVEKIPLYADVWYPSELVSVKVKRPIGKLAVSFTVRTS